jgi:alpha-beta hydrolase superfamily lysophospholipase
MEKIHETPNSKAVVVLVHGMQEYSDRYQDFCDYLADHGYSYIRYDLLGHAKDLPKKERGYFKNGWQGLVDQLHHYVKLAHEKFPGQKVVLFGHSMGTIVIRSYIQQYDDFDAIMLSGAPYYNSAWKAGRTLANMIISFHGERGISPTLGKLATGGFNKKIYRPRTGFDWLCYNPEDVDNYIKDDGCGFPFTNEGYKSLFIGMGDLGKLRDFQTKHPVPLLFMHGVDDPCAGDMDQVYDTVGTLKDAGYRDLTEKDYEGMRHEILFEKDGVKVEEDIVEWLDQKV